MPIENTNAPANFGLPFEKVRMLNDALILRIVAGTNCCLLIADCGLLPTSLQLLSYLIRLAG